MSEFVEVEIYAEFLGEEPHVVMTMATDGNATTMSLPLGGALQVSALFAQQLYLASHLQPGQTTRQGVPEG